MPHQYVREPLTAEESDRLSNACAAPTERLVVWTLIDTGGVVARVGDDGRDGEQLALSRPADDLGGRRCLVHSTYGMILSARLRLRRMMEKSRRSVVKTVRMFSRSARRAKAASASCSLEDS